MTKKGKTKKGFILLEGSLRDFVSFKTDKSPLELQESFFLNPSAKDFIEALGIPHVEVYGLKINKKPANLTQNISDDDCIHVFPVDLLSGKEPYLLKPVDYDPVRFICDVHLGSLARDLRLLGIDTYYDTDLADKEIVRKATNQSRTVLSRDIGLLKYGSLIHGYWIRATKPEEQLTEVVKRFSLQHYFKPFSRCLSCNGLLQQADKENVLDRIPPKVKERTELFIECGQCKKLYWKGTHYVQLKHKVEKIYNRFELDYVS